MPKVVFLNPRTCGIYKDGGDRYKTDSRGRRTKEIDNEMIEHVDAYLAGKRPLREAIVNVESVYSRHVLVPTYWDVRYTKNIKALLKAESLEGITLGQMEEDKTIMIRGGHGSPGNDQRSGHIPYVKVSDIRGLRININPTNLVTEGVARRFWRGSKSGLEAWDLITPNRASSNIGEFAILLPGEENVLITKEVYVIRVLNQEMFDPFYLLWALSLRAVRDQWRRVALMQTNREDCGERYKEIILPKPKNKAWAEITSEAFRSYFQTISNAKVKFIEAVEKSKYEHVANVASTLPVDTENSTDETPKEESGGQAA